MQEDAIVFEVPRQASGSDGFASTSRVWPVGALVAAISDALNARFSNVTVQGEITGFSRAASGHCYFSLKDAQGQLRCAMFRRAAQMLDFVPREGDLVQVRARVAVYEPRGDLQLVVENLERAGQGAMFEQFLRLKAKLEAEGLFDAARKREIPKAPRGIGLVTSLGAAALHDVVTALARRAPQIPVWLAPASVQGAGAPQELCEALSKLYQSTQISRRHEASFDQKTPRVDVILIVRGGGSLEDLWAFNDEQLVRMLAQSPVPVISGVGHETDFTLTDFVADLRAPTPTAAAELCATEQSAWLGAAQLMQERLQDAASNALDAQHQRLDHNGQRLARPAQALAAQKFTLQRLQLNLQHHLLSKHEHSRQEIRRRNADFDQKMQFLLSQQRERVRRAEQSLELLSPQRTLERGYALLRGAQGEVIRSVTQVQKGMPLEAQLSDGTVPLSAH
ncbi:MAG: exodeoxyribonuclease VII large subunit [Brachymonas sp.]